jgi:malonyl CoA-acyl carrier protein transacylase
MHAFKTLSIASALALVTLAGAGHAQQAPSVRTERNMSLGLANEIVSAAVAACTANG